MSSTASKFRLLPKTAHEAWYIIRPPSPSPSPSPPFFQSWSVPATTLPLPLPDPIIDPHPFPPFWGKVNSDEKIIFPPPHDSLRAYLSVSGIPTALKSYVLEVLNGIAWILNESAKTEELKFENFQEEDVYGTTFFVGVGNRDIQVHWESSEAER